MKTATQLSPAKSHQIQAGDDGKKAVFLRLISITPICIFILLEISKIVFLQVKKRQILGQKSTNSTNEFRHFS